MPVTPTYPGVYVQEVPSGVRTIVGVSTSIALFIGRTKYGPMNEPKRCQSYSDFVRKFSADCSQGDMPRQVRLFFANGGTDCYVMRIAKDAQSSKVTLKDENGTSNVLQIEAKSPGLVGDTIRLAVTYNGQYPESTFNLEVFRWTKNSTGATVKTDRELWTALSMDPNDARYAVDYVNQNSSLVRLKDVSAGPTPADSGYSQSGRPIPKRTNTDFRDAAKNLIGKNATNPTHCFRISVDGGEYVNVDLSSIDFTKPPLNTAAGAVNNLGAEIAKLINPNLPGGSQVTVTFTTAGPTGPAGQPNQTTVLMRISSTKGDVRIQPATANDLAVPLMLGAAQGGLDVGRYAKFRPAPTGVVLKRSGIVTFAGLKQTAFDQITIGTTSIDLLTSLNTDTSSTETRMYQDGYSPSETGNSDGVREKLSIIAAAINAKRDSDPNFRWSAEMWGSRLALIPGDGGDNSQGSFKTNAPADPVTALFANNVRYYSLGATGQGNYQTPGVAGSDGTKPTLKEYNDAFKVIDKEVALFNLMILPRDKEHSSSTVKSLWGPASVFCQQRRAFLLIDPPAWKDIDEATHAQKGVNGLRVGLVKDHSAIFYPRIKIRENGTVKKVAPSGAIAGLMARIDGSRGVWKAPAGTEADLRGIVGLEYAFSDRENGVLNKRAINTLRIFPNGVVNWGARTMDGDDDFTSEYKYIPIRRLALFIEESLYRGLKWVVFEPNDEPLWAQIRLNVGAFMHDLFRKGAFQGQKPKDAYFVKCDSETTTETDRNLGIVNIWVGFAPLKPAEFVILYLQQMAGQIQT